LKYTFIGHQSWLIEEESTRILLDPLLEDTFGTDDKYGIEVVPPRIVHSSIYENIDAVIVSHEHSDHFHLSSLNKLSRTIPVYVGVLTMLPMISAIEALGFKVIKLQSRQVVTIKDIKFKAYQAHPKTVLWESRVYQFLFVSLIKSYSIFIAVDALISREFEQDVLEKKISKPNTIMISNNSQIPPDGVIGSLDNSIVPAKENKSRVGALGLRLVKGIIIDYSNMVHDLDHIVLCGGGFMKSGDTFGEFMMSNQGKVAALASPLFPDKKIHGAYPGMVFENDHAQTSWDRGIEHNKNRENKLKEKFKAFVEKPDWQLKSVSNIEEDFHENCKTIISILSKKHRQIMSSDFGRLLVSVAHPSNCFEICLLHVKAKKERRFNFNWLANTWEETHNPNYAPFGIRAAAADFADVATGKIQIWDIAGLSINTWYDPKLGNNPVKYSPMGLIYSVFGEHFNVEQFDHLCLRQLNDLHLEKTAC